MKMMMTKLLLVYYKMYIKIAFVIGDAGEIYSSVRFLRQDRAMGHGAGKLGQFCFWTDWNGFWTLDG